MAATTRHRFALWHAGRPSTVLLIAVLGVGIFVRFFALSQQSLWWDEGGSLALTDNRSLSDLTVRLLSTRGTEAFMPGYFYLLTLWRGIFGSSETAMRVLSALFGSAALVLCMFAADRNWGRTPAFWTALLGAFSAYGVLYSQETRPYAMAFAIISLVLAAYLECRSPRESPAWRLMLAVAALLAIWTSIFSAVFLVALGAADLAMTRSLRSAFKLWWMPALFSASFAIWLAARFVMHVHGLSVPSNQGGVFLKVGFLVSGLLAGTTYGPPLADLRGPERLHVLLDHWPQFALLAIVGIAIAAAIWRNERAKFAARTQTAPDDRRPEVILAAALAVIAVHVAFGMAADFNILPRHAFALWPAVIIALPVLVLGTDWAPVPHRQWAFAALAGLVVLNAFALQNYFFDSRYARDDNRGAARAIDDAHGAKAMLLCGDMRTLAYYTHTPIVLATGVRNSAGGLRALAGDSRQLLFVVNRPFYWRADGKEFLAQALRPHYRLSKTLTFQYFVIYVFDRV
jgi:hypothetical protein